MNCFEDMAWVVMWCPCGHSVSVQAWWDCHIYVELGWQVLGPSLFSQQRQGWLHEDAVSLWAWSRFPRALGHCILSFLGAIRHMANFSQCGRVTDRAEFIPPSFLDPFQGYFLRQLPEQWNSKLGLIIIFFKSVSVKLILWAKDQLGHFNGQKEILCQACRRRRLWAKKLHHTSSP